MDTNVIERPRGRDMMHVPRTKGALSGVLLVAAGLWGALIPFVGPYFDFGFTTDAWSWTANRFWLSVLPGIVAIVAGLILVFSRNRANALIGAALAAVAGLWFVLGAPLSEIWNPGALGTPLGGKTRQTLIMISFFYGLGSLILFLGSSALGRLSVVGVRDVAAARNRRLGMAEATGRHARGHRRHAEVGAAAAPADREYADRSYADREYADRQYADREYADRGYAGRESAGREHAGAEPAGLRPFGREGSAGRPDDRAQVDREPVGAGSDRLDEASVYPDEPRRFHNGHADPRASADHAVDRHDTVDVHGADGNRGPGTRADEEAAGRAMSDRERAEQERRTDQNAPIGAGSGARSGRHHWWERPH
ncbi:hypothetical protein Ga0074812_118139 [Parafrankia irregularis]|uniref:Uncharacterized protein n=1 Tax=Parafrankia irregularis TaxID=795642 RepID=A0A0S4QTA8_9ACTN|nr:MULTISPECIES: hypothetical protein [Parafrankia]MBE3201882.1 hypothetical protein [Parafrankia sp. CH37]CUU58367.1 hypothetical protein Ga0074812_118139 [Parafrankia irregularis]